MRATLQAEDALVSLEFDTVPEVEKFFTETKEQTGFYVKLDHELKQYQKLVFTAMAPPSFEFSFEAEVLQVFPGPEGCGTAFRLLWQPGQSLELANVLEGRPADAMPAGRGAAAKVPVAGDAAGAEASGDSAAGAPEAGAQETRGASSGVAEAGVKQEDHAAVTSPLFKIRNMNPNERFMLATKASRPERQILLRDTSPHVLLGLLAHPRLENKEVLELVKSTHATGAMMDRIAGNRKWMANPEIQLAIMKSPKTSPPLAIKLLDNARVPDLRMLAKSSSVREQVRRAALRVYLKRTGQRGV